MGDKRDEARQAQAVLGAMDPSGLLAGLEDDVCLEFQALLLLAASQGYGRLRVVCARRSFQEQARLYGYGRTVREMQAVKLRTGLAQPARPRVTNALPWEGKHCRGLAMDVDIQVYDSRSWAAFGRLVNLLNLNWGGGFNIRDYGHIESKR